MSKDRVNIIEYTIALINEFATAEEALKKAGYRSVVNFKDGRWVEVPLS